MSDEDGFLFITDRKKDIIITAGGENITPSLIEIELKKYAIVADAVVIGDRRPYLTVRVSLDPEAVVEAGLRVDEVEVAVRVAIDEVNRDLASVRQIKGFKILDRPLSIENGELTPTLKVKRNVVRRNFALEIDALYE